MVLTSPRFHLKKISEEHGCLVQNDSVKNQSGAVTDIPFSRGLEF
jgi:hypothetical protein